MSDTNDSGGTGCTGLLAVGLTILFVWMKLTNQIQWEWLWVLSPLWIYFAIGVVIILIAVLVAAFFGK